MPRENAVKLIRELGAAAGVPDLDLSDDYAAFANEDDFVLNMDYVEDEDVLVFSSAVGFVPEGNRLALYQEMLKANFLWHETAGATLSLDPNGELAMLIASVGVAELTLEQFQNTVSHFTGLSMAWAVRIADLTGEVDLEPEAANKNAFQPASLA